MRAPSIALPLLLLLGLTIARPGAETATMPVGDIRPGMVGIGKTVFEGTRLDEFRATIIGVLENVIGPKRSLILARLEGGPLKETGVIAGMSGSPVYIDGRLIGAVSYSLGQFVKEPIAGITPIAEMTDATLAAAPRPRAALNVEKLYSPSAIADTLRQALGSGRPFADRLSELRALGVSQDVAGDLGLNLRPIAMPLALGGFAGDARQLLSSAFRDAGFMPTASAAPTQSAATPASEPLRPGDAVGVSLVTGDFSLGATGTVTLVDGDRVYAFGHPFFNLGPIAFPMTRAYVHTLLPSMMSSMKLASLGDIVGTVRQDRATAISGTLGSGPSMIPVSLTLEPDRGERRTFKYSVVSDQLLTPLLSLVTIVNTLQSYERQAGAATFSVRGEATVKNHGTVAFDDTFSGDPPSLGTAQYIVAPISALLQNTIAPVEVTGVNLTISSSEQPRTTTLERIWLENARVRPGQTVPLKLVTRTYRGEDVLRTIPITIPSTASGSLSVVVSDAMRTGQSEPRDSRRPAMAQSIDQLIRVLNRTRRNNRLYVRLVNSSAGAVIDGEVLPSLPPSVLAVLDGDRQSGSVAPLASATLGEWEVPIDSTVSGSKTLNIRVDSP